MNKLLNFKIITLLFISIHFVSLAQKPKKTHDHGKFVKKVVFSMGADITKWSPDEDAMMYISTFGDKSIDEIRKSNEINIEQLKEDVAYLNNNNIYRNYQNITVKKISEEPTTADIILHCEWEGKPYDITLKNCVQTNVSWYLGDRIIASGEWIKSMQKETEPEEKKKGGLLSKLEEMNEAEENKASSHNDYAYVGKRFPMQGTDAHTQFYKMNLIGRFLNGYIIDNHNMKQEVKIRYDSPEFLNDPNKNLMIQSSDGISTEYEKNLFQAFYVGDQLFVFTGEFWDILLREGAIRELGRVIKDKEGNYITANLIQKRGLSPENMISLSLGFKNKMSEYVHENETLATKINNKEEGYKFRNTEQIISEYNQWYDDKYPNKVEYLFKPTNTTVETNPLEKIGQDIFIALQSQNPENFKPYLFTLEDIENSSMKPEMKDKMINELKTDQKKSKAEWYGEKADVYRLVEEYKQIADEGVEIEEIEFEEKTDHSEKVGVEVSEAKLHLKIGGQKGYYCRFTLAKLSENWKVVDIRGFITNLNAPAEEEVEEAEEAEGNN